MTLLLWWRVNRIKQRKRIAFSSNWDPTTCSSSWERRSVQRGSSRQVREMRQKREKYIGQEVYIGRPGRLPDVVCCQVVVGMVLQFQHFTAHDFFKCRCYEIDATIFLTTEGVKVGLSYPRFEHPFDQPPNTNVWDIPSMEEMDVKIRLALIDAQEDLKKLGQIFAISISPPVLISFSITSRFACISPKQVLLQ